MVLGDIQAVTLIGLDVPPMGRDPSKHVPQIWWDLDLSPESLRILCLKGPPPKTLSADKVLYLKL